MFRQRIKNLLPAAFQYYAGQLSGNCYLVTTSQLVRYGMRTIDSTQPPTNRNLLRLGILTITNHRMRGDRRRATTAQTFQKQTLRIYATTRRVVNKRVHHARGGLVITF